MQAIIKEMRGEDVSSSGPTSRRCLQPTPLSPAKVSQVRTPTRQPALWRSRWRRSVKSCYRQERPECASRDQLVGWEIKIVSEEILKKEIAQQMGKMMASGEAVISRARGCTTSQAETLAEKGIEDGRATGGGIG